MPRRLRNSGNCLAVGGHITAAWSAAIDAWILYLIATGAPETTRTTRRQHLERTARRIGIPDPWAVTAEQLVAYFGAQDWARETRRGHRTSLRSFYGWGLDQGHAATSPAAGLPKVPPGVPRPRPTPDDVLDYALARATPRELLICRMAGELGMRRAEVAVAHSRDMIRDMTGWSIVAHGKGAKDRVLPVPADLAAALWRWINANGQGYLFPGRCDGHLSPPRWVGTVISRLLVDGYTMHSLRHRFGTNVYRVDHDLVAAQELLGHASVNTTRVYVQADLERLRPTVEAAAAGVRRGLRSVRAR